MFCGCFVNFSFDSRFIKDKLIGYADIHLSSLPFGRQGQFTILR